MHSRHWAATALIIAVLVALTQLPLFAAEGVLGFGNYQPLALKAVPPTATPIAT